MGSSLNLEELNIHLYAFLNFKNKNGQQGLMRFYDPRVFQTFNKMLNDEQALHFWEHIIYVQGWNEISNDFYLDRKEV